MLTRLKSSLIDKLAKLEAKLSEEAHLRNNEFRSVDQHKARNSLSALAIVGLSFLFIFNLLTPPPSITSKLESEKDKFQIFNEGSVYFSNERSPPRSRDVVLHPIRLPDRSISKLSGFDPASVWYEFNVEIPEALAASGKTGILVPKVWGSSRVFVNGKLRDFGTNAWPLIATEERLNFIQINVDIRGHSKLEPIRATYPLVVGEVDELRSLMVQIEEQYQTWPRTLAVYALAIILFGVLYVAYPRKPELLAFVVFLGLSLIDTMIEMQLNASSRQIWSWHVQTGVLVVASCLKNLSLLAFSLFFFRARSANVFGTVAFAMLACAVVGPALVSFFVNSISSHDLRQSIHLSTSLLFFFLSCAFSLPRLVFISTRKGVPLQRKVGGAVILLSILSLYLFNFLDHLAFFTRIVHPYNNTLLVNLALAITVAFEISRAEVHQRVLGSMLPREVKEGLNLNSNGIDQKGFVLLIDAVGYSADRGRFDDSSRRALYVQEMADRMLRPLTSVTQSEVSILSCTGDGLYLAFRGEATAERMDEVLNVANSITKPQATNEIRFRAAVGFGTYGVRIVKCGEMRKEFVAGNILNDLSRIIGSSSSSRSVRVLCGPEVEPLLRSPNKQSVVDKHGFEHIFVEPSFDKTETAA